MGTNNLVGKYVQLKRPVRDHDGKVRFKEENPRITKCLSSLDRSMVEVIFKDGAKMFLLPDQNEYELIDND